MKRNRTIERWLAAILVFAFGPSCATSGTSPGLECEPTFDTIVYAETIETRHLGGVIMTNGVPGEGFKVLVADAENKRQLGATVAQEDGLFSVEVREGIYTVTICKSGYDTIIEKVRVSRQSDRPLLFYEIGPSEH